MGVVGGVVGAAAAAAQSSNLNPNLVHSNQTSNNQTSNIQILNNNENQSQTMTSVQNTNSVKLTKQATEIYDEQLEGYVDPYSAKQVRKFLNKNYLI